MDQLTAAVIGALVASLVAAVFSWRLDVGRRRHAEELHWKGERVRAVARALREVDAYEARIWEYSLTAIRVEAGFDQWGPRPRSEDVDAGLIEAQIVTERGSGLDVALTVLSSRVLLLRIDKPDARAPHFRMAIEDLRQAKQGVRDSITEELALTAKGSRRRWWSRLWGRLH